MSTPETPFPAVNPGGPGKKDPSIETMYSECALGLRSWFPGKAALVGPEPVLA